MTDAVTEVELAEASRPHEVPDLFGEYRFKADSKGRVALPAKFRKVLSGELVVTLELAGKCLYVFQHEEFKSWIDSMFNSKFNGYDPSNQLHQKLMRSIRRGSKDVEVDSAGRIMLAPELREKAGIDKEVVVIGNGEHFEIWDAKRCDDECGSIDLTMLYS